MRRGIMVSLACYGSLGVGSGCVPEDRPTGSVIASSSEQRPPAPAYRSVPRPLSSMGSVPTASTHPPLLSGRFDDAFDRAALGRDYLATSPSWALSEGQLCGENARNRPVWLQRRLPRAVRVEFDAVSHSRDGDIKVELFGDGKSATTSTSYNDASGYVFIYGGWQNRLHVLARLDEHGDDRLALDTRAGGQNPRSAPVTPGQTYRFAIERRDGKTVRWFVDGVQVHALSDSDPLLGPKHEYFGFNTWRARVCFDNLRVVPLGN